MRIQYIGHSCFYFVTDAGVRLVIDPYDTSIGLTPVNVTADIALVTHHHFDHDCMDGVHGDYTLIDGAGAFEVSGVRIHGITVPHDADGGTVRGFVTAYLIETDGLRLLHLGDVGDMPPEEFFAAVGSPVDVLMIPVGGRYTVDAAGALAICERLNPNMVIPMHYKTKRLTVDIAPVSEFVDRARYDYDLQRQGDVLEVRGGTRKKRGRIILMENSF